MPISSLHPQLEKYKEVYEFLEDFYEGEQTVKAKAKKYVPMLSGQSTKKFQEYVSRGMFYNAFAKTIDALIGSAFNVSPAIRLPVKLEYLRDDATGQGTSMTELAMSLCVEALKTGRVGLLVDRPSDGGAPYLVVYDCDDIINWRDGYFIVLEDDQLVPKEDDPYEFEEVEGFRELALIDGEYVVRIWRENTNPKTKAKTPYEIVETYIPEKFGKPMDEIPFVFIGPNGLDSDIGRPPLLDLANVQRIGFACECDRSNAIHVSCIPTPYITGLQPEENFELKMGADQCIVLPSEGCKVGYLEYSGQGLDPVKEYLDKIETTMAALGARVIESRYNKTVIETATGSRLREQLSVSTLGSIVATVEAALNKCVRSAAEWEGADPDEIEITLNKELISTSMDSNTIIALLQSVQAGLISQETFYAKLSDAGLTEPGVSVEEEVKRIEKAMNLVTQRESGDVPNPQQIPTSNDNSEQGVDNT